MFHLCVSVNVFLWRFQGWLDRTQTLNVTEWIQYLVPDSEHKSCNNWNKQTYEQHYINWWCIMQMNAVLLNILICSSSQMRNSLRIVHQDSFHLPKCFYMKENRLKKHVNRQTMTHNTVFLTELSLSFICNTSCYPLCSCCSCTDEITNHPVWSHSFHSWPLWRPPVSSRACCLCGCVCVCVCVSPCVSCRYLWGRIKISATGSTWPVCQST